MKSLTRFFFKVAEVSRRLSTRAVLAILLTDREQFLRFVEYTWRSYTHFMLRAQHPFEELQRVYSAWLGYLRKSLNYEQFNEVQRRFLRVQVYNSIKEGQPQQADQSGVRLSSDFQELKVLLANPDLNFSAPTPEVSVIYPFANRDIKRLIASAASLKLVSEVKFEVILVDYGSVIPEAAEYEAEAEKVGIKYVRVYAEGRPWSRGHALNIGVQQASAKYVLTTDIDMLFATDVLKQALDNHKARVVFHCRPLWLKEDSLKANAWTGDYNQLGGFQFMSREDFLAIGGFNPEIKYWGLEDMEFDRRQRQTGYNIVWLNEQMYHLWHPHDYGDLSLRPESSWLDSELILMRGQALPALTQKDSLLDRANRPILALQAKLSAEELESKEIGIASYDHELELVIAKGQQAKFVRLLLGPRMNPDLKEYYGILKDYDEVFKPYGAQIQPVKSKNFDYFYLSLPILKEQGLIDYYIHPDYSTVDLLFK